jgi:hypothetical protein
MTPAVSAILNAVESPAPVHCVSSLIVEMAEVVIPPADAATVKRKVVLDTAAFIKQTRLEKLGDEFFTIPEVLTEIRDSKARLFLDTLPVKVLKREPTTDAIAAGTSLLYCPFESYSRATFLYRRHGMMSLTPVLCVQLWHFQRRREITHLFQRRI